MGSRLASYPVSIRTSKIGGSFCGEPGTEYEDGSNISPAVAPTTPCQALMVHVVWYHLVLSFRSVLVVIS